jgi:hypothetical protein
VLRADETRALELLLDDEVDLGRVTVVPPETPEVAAATMTLKLREDRPHHIGLEYACDGACLVVVARPWAPGWRAEVDGVRAGLVRANGAGLGVVVPPGRHHVTLGYRPWSR